MIRKCVFSFSIFFSAALRENDKNLGEEVADTWPAPEFFASLTAFYFSFLGAQIVADRATEQHVTQRRNCAQAIPHAGGVWFDSVNAFFRFLNKLFLISYTKMRYLY